jgi:thymidylate kinase
MGYVNGHPMLIELVGVAGSGKSTLKKQLHKSDPMICSVQPPSKSIYFMPLLKIIFKWFPLYLRHYSKTRWFTKQELRNYLYLESWLPHLMRCSLENDKVVVLDPGAFYWLTSLNELGPEITKSEQFLAWWEEMRQKWLSAIDIVVWLDAPTEMLMDRVKKRSEWHESKLLSRVEIIRTFDLYREGYTKLIDQISSRRKNHILKIKTDQTPSDEVFRQVRAIIEKEI